MKRGWIVASLVLLGLCGLTVWQSALLPQIDDLGPGPGFFPLWLALLGLVLSALLIVETARMPAAPAAETLIPDKAATFRILAVIVMLAASAAVLEPLGWRLTALLLTAILLPALGARSLLVIVPFCLAASFGVFHVFYYWLKVPLPIGTFGI
ncbi:MAG: tripartite tricarboxylate transporter TctB family protein [Hyphomicrobiaceae bacterium]|nr:tripartite tricarboxylate transporter TctB family protein [Hyphomicrobiaceae bacterium]